MPSAIPAHVYEVRPRKDKRGIGSAKMWPRRIKLPALLFAGFVTLLAFSCCAKISPIREISGQVFIVMPDGESVKLALVEISLYDASQAEGAFTDWRESVERECEPRFNELEAQAKAILAETERIGNKAKTEDDQSDAEFARQIAHDYLSRVRDRRPALFNGAAALRNLPKEALAKAKTDADGKFSIAVPQFGSYVIVAASRREVGVETENYYWAIRLRKREEQILLNNDNLVSTDNPDSVLHATNSGVEDCREIIASIEGDLRSYASSPYSVNVAPRPPPRQLLVTLTKQTTIKVGQQNVILPVGAQLSLIGRSGSTATVAYDGADYEIPVSSTDLE